MSWVFLRLLFYLLKSTAIFYYYCIFCLCGGKTSSWSIFSYIMASLNNSQSCSTQEGIEFAYNLTEFANATLKDEIQSEVAIVGFATAASTLIILFAEVLLSLEVRVFFNNYIYGCAAIFVYLNSVKILHVPFNDF